MTKAQRVSIGCQQCDKIFVSSSAWFKSMGTFTNVLNQGSLAAALADTELQYLLYQELKIIARAKIRKQASGSTNTTALVHEAFIKLTSNTINRKWTNRHHFFSTAAITMRHILVDQARARLTEKRGGGSIDTEWHDGIGELSQECEQLVALNEALQQLEQVDPGAADLVNLKYFVGLSMSEVAEIMELPLRTIERQWQKVKVMLQLWLTQT